MMQMTGNGVPGAIGQGCRALLSGFEMPWVNGAGEIRQSFGSGAQCELDDTATGYLSAVGAALDHDAESLWITDVIIASSTAFACLCAVNPGDCVAFLPSWSSRMESPSLPLLDALDHFLYQFVGDPDVEPEFYGATTPEEMVSLAVNQGILIGADDFRALLRSGSTQYWITCGDPSNPIRHL